MKKKIILSITIAVLLIGGALLVNPWVEKVSASAGNYPATLHVNKGGTPGTDEELAAALGITVEQLTAAREKAFSAAVDAALKSNYITARQAEALKARSSGFRSLYRYLGKADWAKFEMDTYLAEALGISTADLQAAYSAVRQAKIDQMVKDGEITQEEADLQTAYQAIRQSNTFTASMKQSIAEAIKAEVKAGTITQAQADLLIANFDKMPMGFGRGMNGMRGMWGMRCGADDD